MPIVATCHADTVERLLDVVGSAVDRLAGLPSTAAGPAAGTHLAEARLDLLGRPPSLRDLEALASRARGHLLVTCRPGGPGAPVGEEDRVALLVAAVEAGAAAVDLEHGIVDEMRFRSRVSPRERAVRLVSSRHESRLGTVGPSDEAEFVERFAADAGRSRPWAVKLARPAGSAEEVLRWARAGARGIPDGVGWAPVATGRGGRWLRQLAGLWVGGRRLSDLAYCAADAPLSGFGQTVLEDHVETLGCARVGPRTSAFAVLGWPLDETWSPALHGALFARDGIDAVLAPLPVRDVAEGLRVASTLGLVGGAVTAPHKVAAAAAVDELTERASAAGSVNTLVRRRSGGWLGESLDGPAAADALAVAAPDASPRVAVLGAGGAARALVAELAHRGWPVVVVARRIEAARCLAEAHGCDAAGLDASAAVPAEVVVNATPAGVADLPAASSFPGATVAMDMVTTPPDTGWLRHARAAGLVTVDGLAMLARQAAAQQRAWRSSVLDGPPSPSDADVEATLRSIVGRAVGPRSSDRRGDGRDA